MIDTEKPYINAEYTYFCVGHLELMIQLPHHGNYPTVLNHSAVDLDCPTQLPQRDADGNRHTDILRQDWTYRYTHREALAGSVFITIALHANPHAGDFLDIKELSQQVIVQMEKIEAFAQNLKKENAEWTGDPYDPAPCYQFPKSDVEFKPHTFSGHTFYCTRIGGVGIDALPFDYYLAVRSDAYLRFTFTPSGFPLEDFAGHEARDAFLQSLTEDFMRRIQITANHPVSA